MPTTTTERPLTPSDKRSLEKLVNADFEHLADELDAIGAEVTRQRVEEYEAAQGAVIRAAALLQAKLEKAWARLSADIASIEESAAARGFEVTTGVYGQRGKAYYSTPEVTPEVIGRGAAQIDSEVKGEIARAKVLLSRQRNDAKKTVLLAGISDEAKAVLESIPSARDLLAASRLEITS